MLVRSSALVVLGPLLGACGPARSDIARGGPSDMQSVGSSVTAAPSSGAALGPASASASASALAHTPPPSKPGPCPSPGRDLERLFASAYKTAAERRTREAHQAVDEVLRARLDQLYQAGCRPGATDERLRAELERLFDRTAYATEEHLPHVFVTSRDDETLVVGHSIAGAGALALCQWRNGKLRTRLHVGTALTVPAWAVGNPMAQETKDLLILDYAIVQPPGAADPMLAVASTFPAGVGCWRRMDFRVLTPTADWRTPQAVIDVEIGGRWCGAAKIKAEGAEVTVHYGDFPGELGAAGMARLQARSFRFEGGSFVEHFGFPTETLGDVPGGFSYAANDLVDDWLHKPWTLAQEATVEAARDRLKPLHEKLSLAMARSKSGKKTVEPRFTHERFPEKTADKQRLVVYCALGETQTPCPDWPKPVDFILEKGPVTWIVSDVSPRAGAPKK